MRVLVTGAGGFVGSVLMSRLRATMPQVEVVGLDVAAAPGVTNVGDLSDPTIVSTAVGRGIDALIHLAAVPGGAAERDPELSRRVNVDATLSLFEAAAAASDRPRLVYASTIAIFGDTLPDRVDDETPLRPAMTYGAHKLMVEVAAADMHRRGRADVVCLRLPGIVARPPAPSGLKSAFLSDVFHAHAAGDPFTFPVSPEGQTWLMSVDRCVDNLAHAVTADLSSLPPGRAVTLPALRVRIADLVAALEARDPARQGQVGYTPDAALERAFAAHPPLLADAAVRAGFRHDDELDALVDRVLARIARDGQPGSE